jgi:hypothetical protein
MTRYSIARATRARTRSIATAAAVAMLAMGVTLPAAAAKTAPTPAAASPTAARCTQHAAHRPSDEWLTCIGVRATVSRAPAVGEDTTLDVTLTSDIENDSASLRVELPAGLSFVDAPSASIANTRGLDGVSRVTRATRPTAVRAGGTAHYRYVVRADRPGAMHVSARVNAPTAPGTIDGGYDDVFFTVGATAATSRLAASAAPAHSGTAAVPAGTVIAAPRTARHDAVPPKSLAPAQDERSISASAQAPVGQSCAIGGWFYVDNNSATRAAFNETVQAWDHDDLSADDLLASGVIGQDGRYRLCFANDDGETGGTQEVYVRFTTTNTRWRVRNTAALNQDYFFTTGTVSVCDTCENEFGNVQPGDNSLMRALHAFDEINDLWQTIHGPNQCWDANDTSNCRQMIVNWTSTSTDGTRYLPGTDDIHLVAVDPDAQIVVVHEASHALMDDVYDDAMPPNPNCNPHSIVGSTSLGCAWTEGFAEWLPAQVYNDPNFRWPNGNVQDLEGPSYSAFGWSDGDTVEGRVAGAMIDISDANNEANWDFAAEGIGPQYTTFLNQISNTFGEFVNDRVAQGYEFSDALSRGSTFQNTIDYDFRNPLLSQAEKSLPNLPGGENFGLNTTRAYWSVVGVQPWPGDDDDITVYDNRNFSGLLASSTRGGSDIDWVAIDSNRRAYGDYYPRVVPYSGLNNPIVVEFSEGSTIVPDGVAGAAFSNTDVANVADTFLTAGQPTFFRIVPSGGLDVRVALVRSNASDASSFVVPSTGAAFTVDNGGAGGEEVFSYTESANQYDGLVVTNQGYAGGYYLFRDTSAPTGSVVIGAGNPSRTAFKNITLQTAASDAQTGVYQMRVAVDGTLDTETWEPYHTTKAVTLPGSDGTKTVAVQYRNNATMVSPVYTDTIVFDTRANLTETSITNPPATVARGGSFSVTDTVKNTGRHATTVTTRTRYYVSTNTTKGSGDPLLGGGRNVAALAAGATNSGSATVTVPATGVHGTFYVLACADDTALVAEFAESDNCRASATRVTIPS